MTLSSAVHAVGTADVEAFARELFSRTREVPIVAVTTPHGHRPALIDAEALAEKLGSAAKVVIIETGEATWALGSTLPERLEVYGGAVRIYWPGLTPDSNPFEHPLVFVRDSQHALSVAAKVVAAVAAGPSTSSGRRGLRSIVEQPPGRASHSAGPAAIDGVAGEVQRRVPKKKARELLRAEVRVIKGSKVWIDAGGVRGRILYADEKLSVLAKRLSVGQELSAYRVDGDPSGTPTFSVQGLKPGLGKGRREAISSPTRVEKRPEPVARAVAKGSADLWPQITSWYSVGEVVRGLVCFVEEKWVLVEILPGVALSCGIAEVDWTFVADARQFLTVGQHVAVEILAFDPSRRRGKVSIKRAYGKRVKDPVTVDPSRPPFLDDWNPAPRDEVGAADTLRMELEEVRTEVEALREDRREIRQALAEKRKSLRSAEDRIRDLEQQLDACDPLASEVAFLMAVRVEYARKADEGDRFEFPLQRMRIGPDFLKRVRELQGIDVGKIVEVCAQVACGRAHKIPGRSVHELREGEGGAPARTRTLDGAKAWRCSLQDGTASARRLHWWVVPGEDGPLVEFASVGVHDDLSAS